MPFFGILSGITGFATFISWLITGHNQPWLWARPFRIALLWISSNTLFQVSLIILCLLFTLFCFFSSSLRNDRLFNSLLIDTAYDSEVDSTLSSPQKWKGALYESEVQVLRDYVNPALEARMLINRNPLQADKIAFDLCDIAIGPKDTKSQNLNVLILIAYIHYKSICNKDYEGIRKIFLHNVSTISEDVHPGILAKLYMEWARWISVWSVNTYDVHNEKPTWATDSLALESLKIADSLISYNPEVSQNLLCPIKWNRADVLIRHFDSEKPVETKKIIDSFKDAGECYLNIRMDTYMANIAKYNIALLNANIGHENKSLHDLMDLYFDTDNISAGLMAYGLIAISNEKIPNVGRKSRLIKELENKITDNSGRDCLTVLKHYQKNEVKYENACCVLYECFLTDLMPIQMVFCKQYPDLSASPCL